jgi:hypothetical protein
MLDAKQHQGKFGEDYVRVHSGVGVTCGGVVA